MMRFLYVTDMHGNTNGYRQVFQCAAENGMEAVVFGGDLMPAPYEGTGVVQCHRDFIKTHLLPMLVDFRSSVQADVFLLAGNDDARVCADYLERMEHDGLVRYLHRKLHRFGDLSIYGYSCVPITPFAIKDWDRFDTAGGRAPMCAGRPFFTDSRGIRNIDEENDVRPLGSIEDDFARIAAETPVSETVYVTHAPPANTTLDILHTGEHIGSVAIRRFIDRYQPPLTLHGHIHESPQQSGTFFDRLGRTVAVNPGSSMRTVHAVMIDTADIEGTMKLMVL